MDPFVLRLVERLIDPAKPLSRNRHFHTFDTAEGKTALKISKRLLALERDIAQCLEAGGSSRVELNKAGDGTTQVQIHLERLRSKRTTMLSEAEFNMLRRLPAAGRALR